MQLVNITFEREDRASVVYLNEDGARVELLIEPDFDMTLNEIVDLAAEHDAEHHDAIRESATESE